MMNKNILGFGGGGPPYPPANQAVGYPPGGYLPGGNPPGGYPYAGYPPGGYPPGNCPPPYPPSAPCYNNNDSEHNWTPSSAHSNDIPYRAVHAGHDSNGDTIYAGRAHHCGEFLPAKIIPNKRIGYVCYNGLEVAISNYEILCGENYHWVPSGGGSVPAHAVMTGRTTSGDPLYIGRGHWEGSLTPGKVHPSHGCLYIPYGGREIRLESYEVLVKTPSMTWVPTTGTFMPPQAVHAGHDSDGDAIYVGRAHHNGEFLPAKVIINKGCAYVCHSGQEIVKNHFEVLCGTGYTWIGSASGHVPPNAVESGCTVAGERLYIGRGHWQGSLTPGKIHPSHHCLYIPYGGGEVSLTSYECLVRGGY